MFRHTISNRKQLTSLDSVRNPLHLGRINIGAVTVGTNWRVHHYVARKQLAGRLCPS